jgi:hypothetical protein
MQLKKEKFINFLVKSRVINSQMIAGLQDQGFDFGSSAIILNILYDQSENNQQFLKIYSDALDQTLFSVKDLGMILKLVDITQRSQFSRENVVYLLRVSCSHTETLKHCGQLLHSFCMEMVESQAIFYITQGKFRARRMCQYLELLNILLPVLLCSALLCSMCL